MLTHILIGIAILISTSTTQISNQGIEQVELALPTAKPIPVGDYWDGTPLNPVSGTVIGPSGKETYYNLPMDGVITIMRNAGYSESDYPYWEREDGCKMLGPYVIVAADQRIRPLGTIVPTSLGYGIVCDTGSFIFTDQYQLDVAVTW